MTIEFSTHDISYQKPLDAGAFISALDGLYQKTVDEVRETFEIYGAVASRIVKERKLSVPEDEYSEGVHWDYIGWAGLLIMVNLGKDEGFDVVHDYYEYLSFQTKNSRARVDMKDRVIEPEPEDYGAIGRRAWTFKVGKSRCTLAAVAHYNSNVCKRVEDGTEPKYKIVCDGSSLAA